VRPNDDRPAIGLALGRVGAFALSPVEDQLVAFSFAEKNLFLSNSRGAHPTPLKDYSSRLDCNELSYSPDGKKIAFISHNSIVITEADGSNSATVFKGDNTNSSFLIQVVWSPDGSQLLYSFNDGKSVTSLYVANTDGSNPVLLIQNNDTTGFGAFSWTAMSADAWAAISIGTPTPTVPPTRTPKPSATPKPSTTPKPSATLKATSTPQS